MALLLVRAVNRTSAVKAGLNDSGYRVSIRTLRETKGYGTIFESDWGPFIDSNLVKIREQVRTLMAPRTAALAKD